MKPTGKTFEEIELGMQASFSKTITETDVVLFAAISGDFNPLHMDKEYAKTTVFGQRIAHGGIAASLLAPVLGMQLPGLGTTALETTTKFRKPVFFGDTITCSVQVTEKLPKLRAVRMKVTWKNQKDEVVCKGETLVIPPAPDQS